MARSVVIQVRIWRDTVARERRPPEGGGTIMWQPDGWGWRARIGVLTPHGDIGPEAEFRAMAPEGVSVHAARVPLGAYVAGTHGVMDRVITHDAVRAFAEPPFVDDATEILYRAALEPRLWGEVYFAAHDEHLSVRGIAERILQVLGRGSLKLVSWPDERKRIEVDDVKISSALLANITGFRPQFSFTEGLTRTLEVLEQERRSR